MEKPSNDMFSTDFLHGIANAIPIWQVLGITEEEYDVKYGPPPQKVEEIKK